MKRRTKWTAVRTKCAQGKAHGSKAEARRCDELHLLQRAGEIIELRAHPQPVYALTVSGPCRLTNVGEYRPDFDYRDAKTDRFVVEDVKGRPGDTPVYRLKKKLVEALHGVKVTEIRNGR